MLDRNVTRKRRPVDVLFGDRSASYPDYVIEAPQPVTTVSPPPPELSVAPAPVPGPPPAVVPATSTLPEIAPIAAPPQVVDDAPTFKPEPVEAPQAVATRDRISQLYDEVKNQLGDTRGVAKECMELLLEARIAYTEGDYAMAEYYTESVEARMAQSASSQQLSRRPIVWAIWLWNLAVFLAAAATLIGTYLLNQTPVGVAIAPVGLVLIRTVAWGVMGAVFGAMTSIIWAVRHREYDPANELGYFAKALVGAELGGVFFFLYQIVVVVGNLADLAQLVRISVYLLAALTSLGQDMIIEFLRNLSKAAFHGREE